MSRRQNAVKYPCQNETDGQHHKTYQPVRYQLGGNESELADGGDIYLLDGAHLLLAHHIEGREKPQISVSSITMRAGIMKSL